MSLEKITEKNKTILETEKERVEKEIDEIEKSETFENTASGLQETEIESRAEDLEIKERNTSLRRTLTEYLRQIKSALSRINKKKYGICENCGKPISEERLKVNPAAIYCLECAENQENEEA